MDTEQLQGFVSSIHRRAETRWKRSGPHLKRSLANFAKRTVDQLLRRIKSRLCRLQYRSELTAGFVIKIGLDFKPS